MMEVLRYKLHINLDPNKDTFEGSVKIEIKNSAGKIHLNSADLEIRTLLVNGVESQFTSNIQAEEIIFDGIKGQDVGVDIEYTGKVGQGLTGLYASHYKGGLMLSTHLEAVDARRVLPCIDDPLFKAVFDVSLNVPNEFEAISNTSILSVEEKGEFKEYVFSTTPKMSTYLLYIGVGKFKSIEDKLNNIKIKAITTIDNDVEDLREVLKFGKEFLKWFEEYFGIPYPLDKLDLISVPEFSAAAMENWGAITFRQSSMFINKNTTTKTKRWIATTVSHELVHQWFGNLVTMIWWNDLWLNESFATFMSFIVIDSIYPKWRPWDDFLLIETARSMRIDGLINTHPIEVNVKNPNEIDTAFDEISYGKGGSVLRMIEAFIGSDDFKTGIKNYLEKYKYSNASGNNLWEELENSSRKPVTKIMSSWIKKPGYPIVFAKLENNKLILSQERFTLTKKNAEDIWPIPLVIKNGDSIKEFLFDKAKLEIEIDPKSIIKINYKQTGYYHVLYDEKLLKLLIDNKDTLLPEDRFGIVNDSFALLKADYIRLDQFINIVESFSECEDNLLISSIINNLYGSGTTTRINLGLISVIYNSRKLKEFIFNYSEKHLNRLGWLEKENESEDDSSLRGILLLVQSMFNESASVKLLEMYQSYSEVPANIKRAYATALIKANEKQGYKNVQELMSNATDDDEKSKLMLALFDTTKKDDFLSTLNMIIDGTVKKQDIAIMIIYSLFNSSMRDVTWEWLKINFIKVMDILDSAFWISIMIQRIIPYIGVNDKTGLNEFLKNPKFDIVRVQIKRGLEMLEVDKRLVEKYNK